MEEQNFMYESPNHVAKLNHMRLNNKWCDLTIRVNEMEFRAHKVILAANLKYFETMLSNDSFQESKEGVINMESVDGGDLEAFISYAYTGKILLTASNALNILEIANYLSEDGIKITCIKFLEKYLKPEEACKAYKFSNFIDCGSLKNAAKSIIIANFGKCSQTVDYLDFDYENLTDNLSDGVTQPTELQRVLFEGIIRWIMHDASNRKIWMKDLLNFIDITELTADDLLGYLYETTVDHSNEYSGIIKDIMFCYHTTKIEQKRQRQMLMVVSADVSLDFQFYDFMKKKWFLLHEFENTEYIIDLNGATLNDKFYYISEKYGKNSLQVIDPISKQNKVLYDSSNILCYVAACACTKFLYLIGGYINETLRSNQVLSYNPVENSLETLTPMGSKKSRSAAIFYQGSLYVTGGYDGKLAMKSVEKYDPNTKKWTALSSMNVHRWNHSVAVLEGKLYVCGGIDLDSAEVYDPATNKWQLLASMNKVRFHFLLIAHEDKLFAIEGDAEKTIEVYDPSENQWKIDKEMSSGLRLTCPRGGFVSSRCISGAK